MYSQECTMYTKSQSEINGRGIWHYMIETPIGRFNVVEYEEPSMQIKRFVYDEQQEIAEQQYKRIAHKMVSGK